jgi:hypothetical protein
MCVSRVKSTERRVRYGMLSIASLGIAAINALGGSVASV